ncbi:hypothetical protein GGS23DRAFT_550853 [Durotheca rogersii]|uniref:uncharacterized protein n=1 Tax=Durotheca rogersii TaxID=419775 RepID=UPI00222011CE|nr:uncharacterized protein GGS23DRAFT_550853 [Durotheca rogersii]KAI5866483.1 hypothetical protein GGS23DRAFT_550853 [Durotheca rogersii]
MQFSISVAVFCLASVIAATYGSPPPPQLPIVLGIVSDTAWQCSPGKSINITFLPHTLRLDLPAMRFGAEGHGRTDELAVCQFTAELTSWWYKYRFAIQNVTYKGHLTATDGAQLYRLSANAVFRYENRKLNPGRAPPDIWNVSMSTMVSESASVSPHSTPSPHNPPSCAERGRGQQIYRLTALNRPQSEATGTSTGTSRSATGTLG